MKFLVLFACVAAASAQHLVAYPNGAVAPAKTPSVAAAEAAHFAAKGALYNGAYAGLPYAAGAYPYNGAYAGAYAGALPYAAGAYSAGYPYAGAYGAYNGLYNGAYNGLYAGAYNGHYAGAYAGAYAGYPYGGLVAHPNGAVVPVDEPAVQAAKAEHFAAKGIAPIAAPIAAPFAAPLAYAAGFAYPGLVAHPNGALVPVESAEIQAARAEHLSHF